MSRKKGFYKFDQIVMSRIIEMASLGYSKTEIALTLGVHRNTLCRWIQRYELKDAMNQAENDLAQGTIKRALRQLAEGGESKETVTQYVETGEDGVERQITQRVKKDAPSHKAVEIYARRYDKSFAPSQVAIDTPSQLTLNVNTSAMSLRDLQSLHAESNNPLGAIDTSCQVVGSDDASQDTEGDA